MVGRFLVVRTRLMAVEDGPAKGRPGHRVAIAATRAVTPSEHELEGPSPGTTKERHRGAALETLALGVFDHLTHHGLGMVRVMQLAENLTHQVLLVRTQDVLNRTTGDHPVIVDFLPQWVVELAANQTSLGLVEGSVQLRCEGFRGRGRRGLA